MRYGIVADVHGNLHALEAVVARLSRERLDGWICAGDLVGYGPFPNECVARLSELGAVCVAGNHDLLAVGRLTDASLPPLARKTLEWTRSVLTPSTRARLATLALVARLGKEIVVAHGSPHDPSEYVDTRERAAAVLAQTCVEHREARILVLGHTHRAVARTVRRSLRPDAAGVVRLPVEIALLNPGSVGQSRERRALARGLVLDMGAATATLHALDYDIVACRRALRKAGLPEEAVHLRPSLAVRLKSHAPARRARS